MRQETTQIHLSLKIFQQTLRSKQWEKDEKLQNHLVKKTNMIRELRLLLEKTRDQLVKKEKK